MRRRPIPASCAMCTVLVGALWTLSACPTTPTEGEGEGDIDVDAGFVVVAGERCDQTSVCEAGSTCSAVDGGVGECADGAVGSACSAAAPCDEGLLCPDEVAARSCPGCVPDECRGDGDCASPDVCLLQHDDDGGSCGGRCGAAAVVGEVCLFGTDDGLNFAHTCAAGLRCERVEDLGFQVTFACLLPCSTPGSPCEDGTSVCAPACSGTPACQQTVAEGDTCGIEVFGDSSFCNGRRACPVGLECTADSFGRCSLPGEAGAPCVPDLPPFLDDGCAGALQCDPSSSTCQ